MDHIFESSGFMLNFSHVDFLIAAHVVLFLQFFGSDRLDGF